MGSALPSGCTDDKGTVFGRKTNDRSHIMPDRTGRFAKPIPIGFGLKKIVKRFADRRWSQQQHSRHPAERTKIFINHPSYGLIPDSHALIDKHQPRHDTHYHDRYPQRPEYPLESKPFFTHAKAYHFRHVTVQKTLNHKRKLTIFNTLTVLRQSE